MLRRLWLARGGDELRRGRAIDLPSIFIPEMVGMGPLYQLCDWWPECDGVGDDNGPDKNEIGHWRVLHAAAVNAQVRLFGRPDARNLYTPGGPDGRNPAARPLSFTGGEMPSEDSLPPPGMPSRQSLRTPVVREGETLALASLGRLVLGTTWRGNAYGPWLPAPPPSRRQRARA